MSEPRHPTGAGSPTVAPDAEPAPPDRAGTYAAVLAVEAIVVVALWWFGRHFSA